MTVDSLDVERIGSNDESIKLYVKGLTYSPIKGAKGNIEYLIYLSPSASEQTDIDITSIVNSAHNSEFTN